LTLAIERTVAESIARRLRLEVATLRSDLIVRERGRMVSYQFVTTLGRPCKGGGWPPEGEVWFRVAAA
jgi:hypothetical protein